MQRNVTIDIAKGIGIILVVLGHLSSPMHELGRLSFLRDFVYQFHISLFFFLSGIFMKMGESWGVFLKKKATRLYLPYVVSNLIFLAVYVLAHALNGEQIVPVDTAKHAVKILLGMAVTPLGGATWFLFILLVSQIILKALYQFFVKVEASYFAISVFSLGVLGTLFHPSSMLSKSMVAMLFLYLGNLTSQPKFKPKLEELVPFSTVFFIVSLVALVVCSQVNSVDMSQGKYGNPLLFIISSLAGVMMTYYVSNMLSMTVKVGHFLSYLGASTMWILLLHFLAFRVVNLVQIHVYNDSFETIFAHPCARLSGLWPVAYFILGVGFPLFLCSIFKKKNA